MRLCERCWSPIQPDELFATLAHVTGSRLTGDVTWSHTYLHHYIDGACRRGGDTPR